MNLHTIWIFLVLSLQPVLAAELVISEVFANAPGSGINRGKQWFEIYNPGSDAVPLKGTLVRRLDGDALITAWNFELNTELVLAPNQFIVIAQKADLGVGLCFHIPIVVIEDINYQFKSSGLQTLCVKPKGGKEDCAQISNSKPFPDGRSRFVGPSKSQNNDSVNYWLPEDCHYTPSFYGTPGLEAQICQKNPEALAKIVVPCEAPKVEAPLIVKHPEPVEPGSPPSITHFDWKSVQNGTIELHCQVEDPDDKDLLDIAFFYSIFPAGEHLVKIKSQWDPMNLAPGRYYLFAKARDRFGNATFRMSTEPFVK